MAKKEAPRRNPLEPPDDKQSSMWQTVLSQIGAPERLEAARKPKTKERKREWEKANPSRCYRGVPAEIREQIKEVAEELGVTADEVARALLEYGLLCIQRGTLVIEPAASQRRVRMTLYPFSGAGWAENGWTPQPPKRSGRKKDEPPALWREAAYYRISDELHEQIKRAAQFVPVGEAVAVLLKHGLESYRSGVLVLLPQPKIGPNLTWTGEGK